MDIGFEGLIILIITILGIYYIYNYYINQGLIKVTSDIDNTEYTVQIKEDAKEAADLIAKIKN